MSVEKCYADQIKEIESVQFPWDFDHRAFCKCPRLRMWSNSTICGLKAKYVWAWLVSCLKISQKPHIPYLELYHG